jgi:hypothetical protein
MVEVKDLKKGSSDKAGSRALSEISDIDNHQDIAGWVEFPENPAMQVGYAVEFLGKIGYV